MLLEGSDTPFSAELTVTLNVLHFREETERPVSPRLRQFLPRAG